MIFVIAFDRASNELLAFDRFAEGQRVAAESRYRELLKDRWFDPRDYTIEVNVFESKDEATFRVTHARYFQSTAETIASLRKATS